MLVKKYVLDIIQQQYFLTLITPTNVVFIKKIPSVKTEIACVNFATFNEEKQLF